MRPLRTLWLAGVLGVAGALSAVTPVQAQTACATQAATFTGDCFGPATLYQFTMKDFRLRIQGTTTFKTVKAADTPEKTFNAASVAAGGDLGQFASGGPPLDPATYDAVSPVLSTTWSVQGSTGSSGGPTCFTKTASPFSGATAPAQTFTFTVTSLPASDTVELSGTSIIIKDTSPSGLPLTITANEKVTINTAFDVSFGVKFTFAGGVCTGADLGPILVTMTLTVTP